MGIQMNCPCGHKYNVSDEQAGHRFRCKACGAVLIARRAIQIRCQCGRDYSVGAECAGQRFRCKACGTVLVAGQGTEASPVDDLASDVDFRSKLDAPSPPEKATLPAMSALTRDILSAAKAEKTVAPKSAQQGPLFWLIEGTPPAWLVELFAIIFVIGGVIGGVML
jgi:RNase P subunit RPR2